MIRIPVAQTRIVEFCGKHHIRRLSLFGSVLRKDFFVLAVMWTCWSSLSPGYGRAFKITGNQTQRH